MTNDFIDFVSIQLKKDQKPALYVQLYEALAAMIRSGRLTPGYLLPPVRKFAGFLDINTGTVVSAYKELEKNGYIFSRAGSGSYVAEMQKIIDCDTPEESTVIEIDDPEIRSTEIDTSLINMASISLNPDIVSIEKFKQVMIEVLDRDQGYAFSYQESQGFLPLRESITQYLKTNGVHTSADTVQIISGAQQGIDIVARALLDYGDCVFTETPTYPGAIAAFRSRGAKIIDIPLDEQGMDIDILEEKLRCFRPKLVYLMPNIQNPTGISYSLERRHRLMGLARYYNFFILEDDYISELSYADETMAPLKALDRDDRVIYLKSFSKIFMPGLRLAFLTMPTQLAPRLLSVKHLADISTSGLTQRIFDIYLRRGIWQSHIKAIRQIYKLQFEFTTKAVHSHLPAAVSLIIPRGGLSLWLKLPAKVSARAVVAAAREDGVLITDGGPFSPRPAADSWLRLSFATISLQEIDAGLQIIGQAIARQIN